MTDSAFNIAQMPVFKEIRPISLAEMMTVKLMNRVDSKYIASRTQLADILMMASVEYHVQVVNNQPVSDYDSVYFDTDDMSMYLLHHNNKLNRQKIRTRRYVDSDLTFLEIKSKTNNGRTVKSRIEVSTDDFMNFSANKIANKFIDEAAQYSSLDLMPQLQSSFSRITLVNKAKTERLTIDADLSFNNLRTGEIVFLPDLLVIELKQDGAGHSLMKNILLDLRIKSSSISKYCIGMALTDSQIKSNRFKSKLHLINERIK